MKHQFRVTVEKNDLYDINNLIQISQYLQRFQDFQQISLIKRII